MDEPAAISYASLMDHASGWPKRTQVRLRDVELDVHRRPHAEAVLLDGGDNQHVGAARDAMWIRTAVSSHAREHVATARAMNDTNPTPCWVERSFRCQGRRMGFCWAIVLVSIAGCRQIVDFDEPPPKSSVADEKALPFVPFVPQPDYAEKCTRCAAEKCNADRQACVDDPQCRELLRCYGACSDPLCIARCGSYDLLDYSWGGGSQPLAGWRGAESALLSAYQRCVTVYGDCSTDCGWGLDWGCLDKSNRYRWPASVEKSPLHLKLELLFPENVGVSALVSAYEPPGAGSDLFLLAQETNGWGQVELESPRMFDGLLQIESNADALNEFRVLDYSGPFFRDTRLSIEVFPSDLQPVYPRAGFAGLIIAVTDCVGAPATGITFELKGASGKLYSYPAPFVLGANTDRFGVGFFADVSPANAPVTVFAKRDERIVAQRRVDLRENWLTSIVLRPLSGDE